MFNPIIVLKYTASSRNNVILTEEKVFFVDMQLLMVDYIFQESVTVEPIDISATEAQPPTKLRLNLAPLGKPSFKKGLSIRSM